MSRGLTRKKIGQASVCWSVLSPRVFGVISLPRFWGTMREMSLVNKEKHHVSQFNSFN